MIQASLQHKGKAYQLRFDQPIDISIPLQPDGPRAWYVDRMMLEPVRNAQFTGSVAEGGAVNFRGVWFNPHGHGTHTECVGHISEGIVSINKVLKQSLYMARLLTIEPTTYEGPELAHMKPGDRIIGPEALAGISLTDVEAVAIRSLPNSGDKLHRNYSNTNPSYFHPEFMLGLRKMGIRHFLTDLPSVDREEDGGALLAHRAFWYSAEPGDAGCTITEMIYVPDEVPDGLYLLQLGMAPLENDASPSKPILYALHDM